MSTRRKSDNKQYGSRGSIKAALAERRETVLSKLDKIQTKDELDSVSPDSLGKQSKIQKSKKTNGNQLEQQHSHATTDSQCTDQQTLLEQPSECVQKDQSQVSATSTDTVQGDPACQACVELTKGSITQFMASNKFLEKCPERIEGFNLYDYNDDGCIRGDDLGSALSAVGYVVSPGELTTVCKHLNIKNSTCVDFRLFTAVIAHQIMSCTENQIISAFRLFDKEGRGSIDAKELKHITRVLGVQTDEDQIDDMVREVDVDGDGDIDFEEFVNMIRKDG